MAARFDPELTLMDAVHGWAFAKRGVVGQTMSAAVQRVQAGYRMELRRAERFTIDDDTTRLCCHLSHELDRMQGWAFLARLPYDTVWLEFSLHAKVLEFAAMGSLKEEVALSLVSPRCGFLLTRDETDGARWVAHQFVQIDDDKGGWYPAPGILAYVFDPEGTGYEPVRGSKLWRSSALGARKGFPPFDLYTRADLSEPMRQVDPEHVLFGIYTPEGSPVEDFLTSRTAIIPDPWTEAWLRGKPEEDLHRLYQRQIREEAGQLRWLITLLAMINGLPREIRPVVRRTGTRTANFHVLPYFQHHTITIRVPKEDRVVWARSTLDREIRNSRRPLHDVIGHWRVAEYGKAMRGRICRHQPTMIEHGLGMCERCEMLIRWIPPHQRGDPNIGIVTHDKYKVET